MQDGATAMPRFGPRHYSAGQRCEHGHREQQPRAHARQLVIAKDEADRDGDGEISEDEFLRIMKKTSLY